MMERQRLHKVLAQSGLGSRRDMEALIEQGRVRINGQVAEVGASIGEEDRVTVDQRPVRLQRGEPKIRVLLYHKPEGEIVSRADPQGRPSVFTSLPIIKGGKWVSVGRLDFNTSGLLIFTTSGTLAQRLTHPSFEVEREYAVRTIGSLSEEQMREACRDIPLEDGPAHFESLIDLGGEGSNHWYRVVLREGRNREVRRMFAAMHCMVGRLMRVRFGAVVLPPRLKRGQFIELDEAEIRRLVQWAGMDSSHAEQAGKSVKPTRERVTQRPSAPRATTQKRGARHARGQAR